MANKEILAVHFFLHHTDTQENIFMCTYDKNHEAIASHTDNNTIQEQRTKNTSRIKQSLTNIITQNPDIWDKL